ncbi:MAG: hypothetical protein CMH84_07720 [Nocardioides sp.]|nr:hypothetical protein [Nocardioides sp.]
MGLLTHRLARAATPWTGSTKRYSVVLLATIGHRPPGADVDEDVLRASGPSPLHSPHDTLPREDPGPT